MRRILTLALLTAAATTAAAATLPTALADARGVRAKVQLHQTKYGKILVNARGYTLYAFTLDTRNKDACQNISHCLTAWPVLTTSGTPIAGPGVHKNLLGTVRLKDGTKQVTYAGHPLYTYLGDSRPAETTFIGLYQFNGFWPAVNAAGHEVGPPGT